MAKDASQVILGIVVEEALNEEVALLLGVLEALLLAENLSLTLESGEGRLNVELEFIELLIVKIVDSLLSALRAVIFVVLAIIADESEGLLNVVLVNLLHHGDGLDLTVSLEDLDELLLVP